MGNLIGAAKFLYYEESPLHPKEVAPPCNLVGVSFNPFSFGYDTP